MQIPLGPPPAGLRDIPSVEPFSNAVFALGFSIYLQLAMWNLPRSWRAFLAGFLARRGARRAGDRGPRTPGAPGDPDGGDSSEPAAGDGNIPRRTARFSPRQFLAILAAFFATVLLSWPILLSLPLWAFRDRGSMLNVEYLLDEHLRLGIDTYYSYGLLPVFAQHYLLLVFGRDYRPLLWVDLAALVLMALFWAFLLRHFPRSGIWLIAVIALSPTILVVNPVFPYLLVTLSMIFSLLLALQGRLDWALAVAAVGCLSVPSLPLVLFGLLAILIFMEWMLRPRREIANLARQLAPGVITYAVLFLALVWKFGARSAEITAVPILGRRFYQAVGFGFTTTFMEFLHPRGHSIAYYAEYYAFTPAMWWLLSTVALFVFGGMALARMARRKKAGAKEIFILLCAVLQAVLIFVAYGVPEQHVIYDFMLVAGVLAGICWLTPGRLQRNLLIPFLALGILGQADQARLTLKAWTGTRESARAGDLYAAPAWTSEWSKILDLSKRRRVLLLSYGTGVQDYFPTIHTAHVWFLRIGQLFPSDESRVIQQMKRADVIVEDLDDPTSEIDRDKGIQKELRTACLTTVEPDFQIWRKHPRSGTVCKRNPRVL